MFGYYDQKSVTVVEVNLKWTHSVSQIIAGRKYSLSLIFFRVELVIIKITKSRLYMSFRTGCQQKSISIFGYRV